MSAASRDRFVADFRRVETALPGAKLPWVVRARAMAIERFADGGFPTTRDEEWKYTSLSRLEERSFRALPDGTPDGEAPPGLAAGLAFEGLPGHLVVFVDGRHSPALSHVGRLPAGVFVGSLADALERMPERLEAHLPEGTRHTAFGALNMAFMADGAFVFLPRGVEVAEPIHWLFIATARDAALHPRNLVVAEAGAQATVIEHHADLGAVACLTNAVTQVIAARDAGVEHCKLQRQSRDAIHVAGIHALQGPGSRLISHSIALGAALARHDITTSLEGEGCEAELNGLYVAAGRQHVDHHTRIDHARAGGRSREFYRGILDGASRGVFNGRVIVHPGARRTDAHQANHNLLLSRDAEVDTKPQLEIYADDVKCTHGATVGQLDESQLFYLRSRGLGEAAARGLLTHAFARDVIERIRASSLRAHVERLLLARLSGASLAGEAA